MLQSSVSQNINFIRFYSCHYYSFLLIYSILLIARIRTYFYKNVEEGAYVDGFLATGKMNKFNFDHNCCLQLMWLIEHPVEKSCTPAHLRAIRTAMSAACSMRQL